MAIALNALSVPLANSLLSKVPSKKEKIRCFVKCLLENFPLTPFFVVQLCPTLCRPLLL